MPARTAPRGHQRCADCHEPHGGERRPAATCASCHAGPARTGHGPKVACESCHRAHGPSGPATPPTCASCHPAATRPGLHRAKGHDRCESCHRAHEARPRADRATCSTCHTGIANHEPGATSCIACHPFGDGR
ncbi:MAG: hypothetical protein HS111_14265 [Kofleriaceae bacterium]|nr:hypothetical protein [Kofleriaceae bacterium]